MVHKKNSSNVSGGWDLGGAGQVKNSAGTSGGSLAMDWT